MVLSKDIASMIASDQKTINKVWADVWNKENDSPSINALFKHRLFLEGFPVFLSHIPKDAKSILDVGGGTGRYGLAIAKALPDSHVFITDILDESVAQALEYSKDIGVHNVSVKREDVFGLSFPADTFDVVFCDVVVQHFKNPLGAVSEMTRVLKPGGIMIISCVNVWNFHTFFKKIQTMVGGEYRYGYEKSYTHNALKNLVKSSGLEVVSVDGFYVAYGIYRLKYFHKAFSLFGLISKIVNRIVKFIDSFTGRFLSRKFGFEVFVVARKVNNV
ncbi:MAG: class I SAM-dependent methyltransferase [Candidatus Paceibacterota bacterium]|jgi:ubiquinone/menaquinone biosynthesis C-methylase UbiE